MFLFVLPPLVEPEGHGRGLIVDLSLSVLLLAGVAAVSPHRAVRALLFLLVAGALVVAEALAGQLYPAILLARLVSLATSRGPAGPGQAAPPSGPGQG